MTTANEEAILARIADRVSAINAWMDLAQSGSTSALDLAIALHTHSDFLRLDAALLLDLEIDDEDENLYDDQT